MRLQGKLYSRQLRAKATLIFALLLCSPAIAADRGETYRAVVGGALGWYHRWISPLERSSDEFECRGVAYAQRRAFLYCDPGNVEVTLISDMKPPTMSVLLVVSYGREFEEALESFKEMVTERFDSPSQLSVAVPASRVFSRPVSPELSEKFMLRTREIFMDYLERSSRDGKANNASILFPMISRGDPFYHVYVTSGKEVKSIWEFTVHGEEVADFAHWVFDREHHSIPPIASTAVAEESRWFQILAEKPVD